jgi:DNA-binding NarL/FixJ family response regulator
MHRAQRTTVLLVDDHAIMRAAIRAVLRGEPDLEVVGEAASAEEALPAIDALRPRVVVMDLRMPGLGGIDGTLAIRERAVATAVLVFSVAGDARDVRRALAVGADGYVPKSAPAEDLVAAIRAVAAGDRHVHASLAGTLARPAPADPIDALTPLELQVARLVALGHTTAEIGARLGSGPRGVEHIRAAALGKLGARTRAELVSAFIAAGRFPGGDDVPTPSPAPARSPPG